jgi:hypothetical protein
VTGRRRPDGLATSPTLVPCRKGRSPRRPEPLADAPSDDGRSAHLLAGTAPKRRARPPVNASDGLDTTDTRPGSTVPEPKLRRGRAPCACRTRGRLAAFPATTAAPRCRRRWPGPPLASLAAPVARFPCACRAEAPQARGAWSPYPWATFRLPSLTAGVPEHTACRADRRSPVARTTSGPLRVLPGPRSVHHSQPSCSLGWRQPPPRSPPGAEAPRRVRGLCCLRSFDLAGSFPLPTSRRSARTGADVAAGPSGDEPWAAAPGCRAEAPLPGAGPGSPVVLEPRLPGSLVPGRQACSTPGLAVSCFPRPPAPATAAMRRGASLRCAGVGWPVSTWAGRRTPAADRSPLPVAGADPRRQATSQSNPRGRPSDPAKTCRTRVRQ